MQENYKKICTVIVSRENDFDKIQNSIKSLKKNSINNIIVAIEHKNNGEIKKLFKENNIKYFEYNILKEVYYELIKNENFDYISFINEGDTYSDNLKKDLFDIIEDSNFEIYVCSIKYNDEKYLFNKKLRDNYKINIEENPSSVWLHLNSVFISKSTLNKIEKNDSILSYYEEEILLTKLISLNCGYKSIKRVTLFSANPLEDSLVASIKEYDILWYQDIFIYIRNVIEFSFKYFGNVLKYIQYCVMYLLKNIINSNVNNKNKHILKEKDIEDFYNNVCKVLQNIEDDIIMKTFDNGLVNYHFLKLKYNVGINYRQFLDGSVFVVQDNKIIFNAASTKIKVFLMEMKNNKLFITANFPFPFKEEILKIYVKYNNKKIYVTKNNLYQKYKIFGKKIYENYMFDVVIPIDKNIQKEYVSFYLESEGKFIKLPLNFNTHLSRLNNSRFSYWIVDGYTINYRQSSLMIMKNNFFRHVKRELKYLLSLIYRNTRLRKLAFLRILYYITKPFFNKEIWLFQDKIFKAGDNGEYLYNYAISQCDGIKKYYIFKKDCLDAKRFKKENKKYVVFGSLKHKILFLNANIIFETHNSFTKQHSFDALSEQYFRDLFKSLNVCIQHGLSVQYIPHLVNRINDNLKMFFLSSPIEKKNLENVEYCYEGYENVLKITGSPRYDGLKNNDKKQILITPTWRNYLAVPVKNISTGRIYNSNFKNSKYFKIYNNLINNDKLITNASKNGYKIIYLLHPCTSPQIEDFKKNDSVKLIAATDDLNYEKILTESSLMVTDYSGVQFDFAYMYKPVIYFHPIELPPSYDEGEYKYEEMSLGEIVKTSNELVDLLCEYMDNQCKIKNKYKDRIDNFFEYHDYNNCQRIYDEVIKERYKK